MADDLWPDDAFAVVALIPPVQVVREQAAALTERTKGLLRGEVDTTSNGWQLLHSLVVHAPALDYKTALLQVIHLPEQMYPADVRIVLSPNAPPTIKAKDDTELRAAIKTCLANDHVKRSVSNLFAQVQGPT